MNATINSNGNGRAARFDDGVPERGIEAIKAAEAARAARIREGDAKAAVPDEVPESESPAPAEEAKAAGGGRLFTCDKYPGEKLTARGWSAVTGLPAQSIYNAAGRNNKAGGMMFASVDGQPLPSKPKHGSKGKPGRKPKAKGKGDASGNDFQMAQKPVVRQAPAQPVMMATLPPLSGQQIALLITSIGKHPQQADIVSAIDWANHVRQQHQQLAAVLEGGASLIIREGQVKAALQQ